MCFWSTNSGLEVYWQSAFAWFFLPFTSVGHVWTLTPVQSPPPTTEWTWHCSTYSAKVRFQCQVDVHTDDAVVSTPGLRTWNKISISSSSKQFDFRLGPRKCRSCWLVRTRKWARFEHFPSQTWCWGHPRLSNSKKRQLWMLNEVGIWICCSSVTAGRRCGAASPSGSASGAATTTASTARLSSNSSASSATAAKPLRSDLPFSLPDGTSFCSEYSMFCNFLFWWFTSRYPWGFFLFIDCFHSEYSWSGHHLVSAPRGSWWFCGNTLQRFFELLFINSMVNLLFVYIFLWIVPSWTG